MSDKETLDVYDAKAQEYANKFDTVKARDSQFVAFLDGLPEKANLLDLGCGPGRAAAAMAAAGHTVTATDASAGMIDLAARLPGVTARQETFDEISGEALYDGIWANFSLLHAEREDLPRHLAALSQALKPGGLFHIGMKTGAGMGRDGIGRRYTYVTQDELTKLLLEVGLTPHQHWTGRDKGLAGTEDPWIVMHARKNA